MLSKLRPRSIYDVMAAIACLGVLVGGSAYAANTIGSADIIDNEVRSADVRNDTSSGGGLGSIDIANGEMTTNEIRDDNQAFGGLFGQDLAAGSVASSEVSNGNLNDEDIAQATFVDFEANIGAVPAHSCGYSEVTGINAQGDHLLLTPSLIGSSNLSYSIEYSTRFESAAIKACNPTAAAINGGTSKFNLLVIDAQ